MVSVHPFSLQNSEKTELKDSLETDQSAVRKNPLFGIKTSRSESVALMVVLMVIKRPAVNTIENIFSDKTSKVPLFIRTVVASFLFSIDKAGFID